MVNSKIRLWYIRHLSQELTIIASTIAMGNIPATICLVLL